MAAHDGVTIRISGDRMEAALVIEADLTAEEVGEEICQTVVRTAGIPLTLSLIHI